MVTAYSIIANGGQSITPSMIDRIQDRYGKTVFKHDNRQCEGCNAQEWANQDEPTLIDNRDQVLDPMTAYQITSMMEGVVQRGTAQILKSLDRPLAGKTERPTRKRMPGSWASHLISWLAFSWDMIRLLAWPRQYGRWPCRAGVQVLHGAGFGSNAEG
ncbi:penicillin-binding transpeptidase domain-containing protein [Brucella abortus]|nr:penicillin-binding transpeptidase domain-containing protein [Brucella abortus]